MRVQRTRPQPRRRHSARAPGRPRPRRPQGKSVRQGKARGGRGGGGRRSHLSVGIPLSPFLRWPAGILCLPIHSAFSKVGWGCLPLMRGARSPHSDLRGCATCVAPEHFRTLLRSFRRTAHSSSSWCGSTGNFIKLSWPSDDRIRIFDLVSAAWGPFDTSQVLLPWRSVTALVTLRLCLEPTW